MNHQLLSALASHLELDEESWRGLVASRVPGASTDEGLVERLTSVRRRALSGPRRPTSEELQLALATACVLHERRGEAGAR